MSVTLFTSDTTSHPTRAAPRMASPQTARLLLMAIVVAAFAAGLLVTPEAARTRAVDAAGGDLTRLLRAMAAIKAVLAAGATGAILWRLGGAVTAPWFVAYGVAAAAMAAGPGLIWDMAHPGLGALVLHGGLFAAVVLLWRDPAVGVRFSEMIAARRALLRSGGS